MYLGVCYFYRSVGTHPQGDEPFALHWCQTLLIRELRCAVWPCGACAAQGEISQVTGCRLARS